MPARRPGGKAARRKARQRNVPRTPRPDAPRPPEPVVEPAPEAEGAATAEPRAVPPVGTPDAREAVALDPPRRRTAPTSTTGGSGLSARDRADYHYVERDLRNIAILTAVMAVLLLLAWLLFNALGLVG